jgi:hypothetical protein
MFSYRQVICNRGTLNGRILRFGGRTGVLRSNYQAALQVAAPHIGALQIDALARSTSFRVCSFSEKFEFASSRRANSIISYQKARSCDQLDLPTSMHMRTAMLPINHSKHVSARRQWHGKKSLVAILWQFVEQPEAWIPGCILSCGNRLRGFGHPAWDSLPPAQFQAIYDFRVRSFRCRSTSSSPSSP